MNCPSCERELSHLVIRGVTLDACNGGCGGIWFDNFELSKFDDPIDPGADELAQIRIDPSLNLDLDRKRSCPRCGDVIMTRHFTSKSKRALVDTCPGCNGCWLDAGEIFSIRRDRDKLP